MHSTSVAMIFDWQNNNDGCYVLQNGTSLRITTRTRGRVVLNDTSNRLFIDDVWPGSKVLADVLDQNPTFCKDKIVLEIGAGAALPSLVASALGARSIVITDYPEISVLENISELITRNKLVNCQVLGYKWGEDVDILQRACEGRDGYDLILLAELLWKDTYSEHIRLLQTISKCLSKSSGIALMAFSHRPSSTHTEANDMEFFEKAHRLFQLNCTFICTSDKYRDVDSDENALVKVYCLHYSDFHI